MKLILLSLILIILTFSVYADNYWVFFTDKDIERRGGEQAVINELYTYLSPRAIWRRNIRGNAPCINDALPSENYINEVENLGYTVVGMSRWLNCVIISTDETSEVLDLQELVFVREVKRISSYVAKEELDKKISENFFDLNYGFSEFQLSFTGIKACQDEGYRGEGVIIAIFDTGFDRHHEALLRYTEHDSLIVDEWDFVNGNRSTESSDTTDTMDYGANRLAEFRHGTRMFGLIGGFKSGQLVGAAKNSLFCLYKTEWYDGGREDVIMEEHWWVLAAERADSAGADIISSSLGYRNFRDTTDWSYSDMNGSTAYVSQAAYAAASNAGIIVVTAMGNIVWAVGSIDPALDTCIKAPADADLVLSIGGTDSSGAHYRKMSTVGSTDYWYASAGGPTSDGRLKPVTCASWWALTVEPQIGDSGYSYGGGTSMATAVSAGGVALLLQAHPSWNLTKVMHALKTTASRSSNPDTLLGWGVSNFHAALHTETPEVPPVTSSSIQNVYPNPFLHGNNNDLTIEYVLLDRTNVDFYIYSIDGTLVWKTEIGVIDDGVATITWNGRNLSGEHVASGIYYIKLETGYGKDIKRVVIIR